MIPNNYLERLYAGWLAKIIGIRLGAPIEGWTYQKIKDIYGDLRHYPVDYKDFAADDDSNGPLFFLRALDDLKPGRELTAQDVGEALLDYAPFERGSAWATWRRSWASFAASRASVMIGSSPCMTCSSAPAAVRFAEHHGRALRRQLHRDAGLPRGG